MLYNGYYNQASQSPGFSEQGAIGALGQSMYDKWKQGGIGIKGGFNANQPQMQPLQQGGLNPYGSQAHTPSNPMFPTQQMAGQSFTPQMSSQGQSGSSMGQTMPMMPKMDFAEFFRKVQAGEMEGPPNGLPIFDPSKLKQQGVQNGLQ